MNPAGQTHGQLDWLLTDFMRGTPGVLHVLVVAGDGMRLAASDRSGRGGAGTGQRPRLLDGLRSR